MIYASHAAYRSSPAAAGGVWQSFSPAQLKATLVFAALVFFMHMLLNPAYTAGEVWQWNALWERHPLRQFLSDCVGALALLVAISVADRAAGRETRRLPYVVAILFAASAWAGIEIAVQRLFGIELAYTPPGSRNGDGSLWLTLHGLLEWLMLAAGATFLYLDARRAQDEGDRLQKAVLERSRAAKRILESRLQAMQARVEPQFLFNTLAQVRQLYRSDFASGERMLDGLIAYLRAAMPQMRDSSSTAHRELELARAYLEIARLRFGERFTVAVDAAEVIGEVRMPPMMLLPLIDQVFVHGFGHASTSGSMRIVCSTAGGVLRVAIAHNGGGFLHEVDADTISSLRERLATLYGGEARLEVRRGESWTTEAVMELPCERILQSGSAPAA